MIAEKMLLRHFEKKYFALEIGIEDNMPNVCANIDNPPNESIAVMAVSCVCICSGDWLKRKAPFVISNIPPNIAAIAEEERENIPEKYFAKNAIMPVC